MELNPCMFFHQWMESSRVGIASKCKWWSLVLHNSYQARGWDFLSFIPDRRPKVCKIWDDHSKCQPLLIFWCLHSLAWSMSPWLHIFRFHDMWVKLSQNIRPPFIYTTDVDLSVEHRGVGHSLHILQGVGWVKCNNCGIKVRKHVHGRNKSYSARCNLRYEIQMQITLNDMNCVLSWA